MGGSIVIVSILSYCTFQPITLPVTTGRSVLSPLCMRPCPCLDGLMYWLRIGHLKYILPGGNRGM